ncbi:M14 family metallopeptidase [Pseudomonas sp. GCM10022186]|uniref:M14 family metallopeptidase n=1 Tax=Pseudomonas sp. GCM10022186 TaxID=3252650 RepID=UPI0036195CCC
MKKKNISEIFSKTYAESREKFLASAQAKGFLVDSYELDLQGAEGEALACDVAIDGPLDASKLLVIISGVHGVEGFAGSAVQTGLIRADYSRPAETAILYVHAINPHGFSHLRRVTQENVDLNRNFVDFVSALPENPGYAELHDALLPENWPPRSDEALHDYRLKNGEKALQHAISMGQYQFPDGMWFGGKEPVWSNSTVRAVFRKYASKAKVLASIDIHTGLGPYGYGEKIFASFDECALDLAEKWWGEITNVNAGTSTSVPMSGPVQVALTEECSKAKHVGICLEYGTYPLEKIISALRADHCLYRYGNYSIPQAMEVRSRLKEAFYPNEPEWNAKVWEQAEVVFTQALKGLEGETCGYPE